MNKSKLRSKILRIRKNYFNKGIHINLGKFFSHLNNITQSRNIGGYYPSNYEINTLHILDLLEKKNFKISLPVIKKNNQMNFLTSSTDDPLKINKFGIPEPISSKIVYPDILLVPLVGYDKNLNRLGYGGGFYDRYIAKNEKMKKIIKIGLAFSNQKIKNVPINQYDKKLDFIMTEKEILK